MGLLVFSTNCSLILFLDPFFKYKVLMTFAYLRHLPIHAIMKTAAKSLQLCLTTPLLFAISLFTHLLLTDVGIKGILIGNSFFLICNIGTSHYTSVLCGLMQRDCLDICLSKIKMCYNTQLTKMCSHKFFPAHARHIKEFKNKSRKPISY